MKHVLVAKRRDEPMRQAERSEAIGAVQQSLDALDSREREIIMLRFGVANGYRYSLEQVGGYFKITRERVRQIEAKARRKLGRMPALIDAANEIDDDRPPCLGERSDPLHQFWTRRTMKGAKGIASALGVRVGCVDWWVFKRGMPASRHPVTADKGEVLAWLREQPGVRREWKSAGEMNHAVRVLEVWEAGLSSFTSQRRTEA